MDHPVLTPAYFMCALGLPVRNSFQAGFAWCPQRLVLDGAVGIVWDFFARVAQVSHVRFGRGGIWWPWGLRILVTGKLKANQVA